MSDFKSEIAGILQKQLGNPPNQKVVEELYELLTSYEFARMRADNYDVTDWLWEILADEMNERDILEVINRLLKLYDEWQPDWDYEQIMGGYNESKIN